MNLVKIGSGDWMNASLLPLSLTRSELLRELLAIVPASLVQLAICGSKEKQPYPWHDCFSLAHIHLTKWNQIKAELIEMWKMVSVALEPVLAVE